MTYKKLAIALILGIGMQLQAGSAATLLAQIDPINGGSIEIAGSYYLGWDVQSDVTINASDVILDLNGHTIHGTITVANGSHSITIMKGFTQKISINQCNNITLTKLTLSGSTTLGLNAVNTSNLVISDILFRNNSETGCEISGCTDVSIDNCVFANNGGRGLLIINNTSKNVIVENCTSINNNQSHINAAGFEVSGGANVVFDSCISLQNFDGFGLTNSASNIYLINCIADTNNGDGFTVTTSSGLIENCIAQNNAADGFNIDNTQANVIEECTAFNNTANGFNNNGAGSNAIFQSNYAYSNGTNYAGGGFSALSPTSGSAQFWRNITE